MNLTFANRYCQDKTIKSGSSYYYSFMFLPSPKRQAITALYAFCREIDDIVDTCQEKTVAHQKLLWWSNELNVIFKNKSHHPIGMALMEAIQNFDLPKILFDELIQGMSMDIKFQGYQSFEDLKLYCHCVASTVGLLAVRIFGFGHLETLDYGRNLGLAFQLTNIIRDTYEDLAIGRFYLPNEELAQFSITLDDIKYFKNRDNWNLFINYQIERARAYYKKAFSHLKHDDRVKQMSGLIMAEIYQTLLNKIESEGLHPNKKIRLSPIKKLWIAWRTHRFETKRG